MISCSRRSLAATSPGPGAGERRSPARSSRTRGSICLKQLHLVFVFVFVIALEAFPPTWPSPGSSSCTLGARTTCWGWGGGRAGCNLPSKGRRPPALLAPKQILFNQEKFLVCDFQLRNNLFLRKSSFSRIDIVGYLAAWGWFCFRYDANYWQILMKISRGRGRTTLMLIQPTKVEYWWWNF